MRDIYLLVLMSLYCCSITAVRASEQKEQAPDPFTLLLQQSDDQQTEELGTDHLGEDLTRSLSAPLTSDSSMSTLFGGFLDSPPLNPSFLNSSNGSQVTASPAAMPMSFASSSSSQNSLQPRSLVQGCPPSSPYNVLPIAQWQTASASATALQYIQSTSPKKSPAKPKKSPAKSKKSSAKNYGNAAEDVDLPDYICGYCDKEFNSKAPLDMHFESDHRGLTPKAKCGFCGITTRETELLSRHVIWHLSEANSSRTPNAPAVVSGPSIETPFPFGCGHCRQAFSTIESLRTHIDSHPSTERYLGAKQSICRVCHKERFIESHPELLAEHMKSHFPDLATHSSSYSMSGSTSGSSSSYSLTSSSTHSLANSSVSSSSSLGSSSGSASSVGSSYTNSMSSLNSSQRAQSTPPVSPKKSQKKRKEPASPALQQPPTAGKDSPTKRPQPLYGTPYGCGHCKTAIGSQKDLLAHIKLYHPESGPNKRSICRICNDLTFMDSDLDLIEDHMEEQHQEHMKKRGR